MTDIRKLMEEASPLPWGKAEDNDWVAYSDSDEAKNPIQTLEGGDLMYDLDLALASVNALPAVLELIKAVKNISMNCMQDEVDAAVDAADALAKALGVAGE